MPPVPTELLVRKALELRNEAGRLPAALALHGARQLLRVARCQQRLGRRLTLCEAERIMKLDLQPWEFDHA